MIYQTTKDAELDFARIIKIDQSQVLMYRKKNRIIAVSRLHVKDKVYATMQAEKEFTCAEEVQVMFLCHQGPIKIKVDFFPDTPQLEDVARELFEQMQQRVLRINAE